MQAPKPQVSIFANEGVLPLWSDPDVGHKCRAGPTVCAAAIRRRANQQRCRVLCRSPSIGEARTRTRSTLTVRGVGVGERRADARGLKQALQFGQQLFRVRLSRRTDAKAAVAFHLCVFSGPLKAHFTPYSLRCAKTLPTEGGDYRCRVEPCQGTWVILMTPEKVN
jgi:hypothetical protein